MRELGSLVGLLVGAAVGRREGLAAQHRLAAAEVAARLGSPDWLAGQGTREALEQLARVRGLAGGRLRCCSARWPGAGRWINGWVVFTMWCCSGTTFRLRAA